MKLSILRDFLSLNTHVFSFSVDRKSTGNRFRVTHRAQPDKMAACIKLRSAVLLRTLPVLSLYSRSLRPSTAAAAWRSVCTTAPGDQKMTLIESTAEYKFVERLIPPSQVPAPPKHTGRTPSGWCPPAETPPPLPYMIRRSRMHNVPVYTDLTFGNRQTTLIRKVEGDIWALEKDVKQYLKELTGKELPTQVNEVTMTLKVKGHFDAELKEWLVSKGFWTISPPRLPERMNPRRGIQLTGFKWIFFFFEFIGLPRQSETWKDIEFVAYATLLVKS